jgi:hypothetical protein
VEGCVAVFQFLFAVAAVVSLAAFGGVFATDLVSAAFLAWGVRIGYRRGGDGK